MVLVDTHETPVKRMISRFDISELPPIPSARMSELQESEVITKGNKATSGVGFDLALNLPQKTNQESQNPYTSNSKNQNSFLPPIGKPSSLSKVPEPVQISSYDKIEPENQDFQKLPKNSSFEAPLPKKMTSSDIYYESEQVSRDNFFAAFKNLTPEKQESLLRSMSKEMRIPRLQLNSIGEVSPTNPYYEKSHPGVPLGKMVESGIEPVGTFGPGSGLKLANTADTKQVS